LRRGLHKRGGVWWISYQKDGQQVRESSGCSNERAASRHREKRISEVGAGTWQPAATTAPRLSVFTETFLSWVSNPTTRDRYRWSLNNLIEYLNDPILSNISTAQLYQYQVDGLKAGKSPATLNRDNAALRRLYSLGKKRGLITILRNPCSDVEPLNETETRKSGHPFTRQEEARITSMASGWFLMLFILLMETGLRVRKEALSLRWDDVDLDSEPGRIVIRRSKTAAGVRTVFLTDYCRNALRQWKTVTGPALSDFVFANPNNPASHIRDYKRQWKSIAKKAGIVGHKFYDTRSTFATRVNACAQSILTVAQLLGHKGTSVSVLPAYVRPLDENTRSILTSLDAARAAANKTPVVQ
jgi:integrase